MAEIETDKATMDFESYSDGTLLYIGVEEGNAVPIDALIAVLGAEGEDYQSAIAANSAAAPKVEEKKEEPAAVVEDKKPQATVEAKPKVDKKSIPATVIRMPALSDTMTEGVINKWNFKVGDTVKSDDSLADVETDKATMEVVGYEAGTLLYIGPKEGEAAPVNGIIAIVGKAGTDITPLLDDSEAAPVAVTEAPAVVAAEAVATEAPSDTTGSKEDDSRIKASPLARKIAKEKGINLNDVKGSAEGGRIIKKDIEEYKPGMKAAPVAAAVAGVATAAVAAEVVGTKAVAPAAAPLPAYTGEEKYTERSVTQMRKAISRRLSESLFTAPHFYVTMSIDMDQAIAARTRINEVAPVKISFNDFVLKACAVALKTTPGYKLIIYG